MDQLCTLTLRTAEALETCAGVHWPRHVETSPHLDLTVRGSWTTQDPATHQLVALISDEVLLDPAGVA